MPDTTTRTLVITAAYTGMRISELTALTRANLRLDQASIHISATTGALHEVAGHQHLGPPKTPAAVRDIALPPLLVDGLEQLLRTHRYDLLHTRRPVDLADRLHLPPMASRLRRRPQARLAADHPRNEPLHRLTDSGKIDENRAVSIATCKDVWGPDYATGGLECDEFPFASTYEGAKYGTEANGGFKRYSVRPIPAADNNDGGGNRLKDFYWQNRILDNEAFHVDIIP